MTRKRFITYLLLAVITLAMACAPPPQAATTATQSETAADAAEPVNDTSGEMRSVLRLPHPLWWDGKESLDPSGPTAFSYATVLLYDRLVRLDENGQLMPELAASWEPNDDATAWTFTLQPGVTFHNGQPFTSADVAYTFSYILAPDSESHLASVLGLITEMITPDDLTIVFQLEQGHADFPLLLTNFRALIIQEGSAETIDQGIGTGPFRLEMLDAEGVTVLSANDEYWKGAPGLAGIELFALADAEARSAAMQAGQIDLLVEATAEQVALFEGDQAFTIVRFPSGRWAAVAMRTDTPPFDDVRVRQAMRLVANRQEIIDLVLGGEGTVTCDTPVMPTDAYRWDGTCAQDIEQATALLAEAGFADGLDVTLYASNTDAQWVPLAQVYQQQAAAAGINVTIEIVPGDSYWSDVWMAESFFTTYWEERPADQILNEGWRSTATWNEAYFQSPELDQLLDEARMTLDLETRREKYQSVQRLIAEEGGHVIPYHVNQFHVVSATVSGIPPQSWTDLEWHLISKSD